MIKSIDLYFLIIALITFILSLIAKFSIEETTMLILILIMLLYLFYKSIR